MWLFFFCSVLTDIFILIYRTKADSSIFFSPVVFHCIWRIKEKTSALITDGLFSHPSSYTWIVHISVTWSKCWNELCVGQNQLRLWPVPSACLTRCYRGHEHQVKCQHRSLALEHFTASEKEGRQIIKEQRMSQQEHSTKTQRALNSDYKPETPSKLANILCLSKNIQDKLGRSMNASWVLNFLFKNTLLAKVWLDELLRMF